MIFGYTFHFWSGLTSCENVIKCHAGSGWRLRYFRADVKYFSTNFQIFLYLSAIRAETHDRQLVSMILRKFLPLELWVGANGAL